MTCSFSTGGFIERVLVQGADAVRDYVAECKKLGFDIIEISAVRLNLDG
jgi:phosphosulfolactate synthase (CoM biosynthesis protein A)